MEIPKTAYSKRNGELYGKETADRGGNCANSKRADGYQEPKEAQCGKKVGKLSVLNGAAGVLAYDDMNPPEAELKVIIGLLDARSEEELSIRGLMDPREYLLSCLRNREDPTSREYVSRYIRSENRALKECALLAQAGKKSRYE